MPEEDCQVVAPSYLSGLYVHNQTNMQYSALIIIMQYQYSCHVANTTDSITYGRVGYIYGNM